VVTLGEAITDLDEPAYGTTGRPSRHRHSPAAVADANGYRLSRFASRAVQELAAEDQQLCELLSREHRRQRETLMMVAASSIEAPSVLACSGSSLSNLTVEGYPGARYHAGAQVADDIERLAIARACAAFGASAANVQPHSGSSANLAVLTSLLDPGQTILGLSLDSGGHLTHGSRASITGRYFRSIGYHLDPQGNIDYDELAALAREHRPQVIIAGASAYPRQLDFERFRTVADSVGAYLMADISHIAGLVVAGLHPSPIDHAHVSTTSTYKQLYGPRGGLILLGRDHDTPGPDGRTPLHSLMNRAVFPHSQGTPDLGNVAAKARALDLVSGAPFRAMMRLLVDGAQAIATRLSAHGLDLVTGGTDTHLVLVDLASTGLTGDIVEQSLERCGIVINRNRVPGDTTPARVTRGIRIGTNTLAARRMPPEVAASCADLVAFVIDDLRRHGRDSLSEETFEQVRASVSQLCKRYPLPGYGD
jgi:glycine hydroxymethyltransferase